MVFAFCVKNSCAHSAVKYFHCISVVGIKRLKSKKRIYNQWVGSSENGQEYTLSPSRASVQSTGVEGGEANESWRIQSWLDVRAPPLLVASPLTEWAIWAAEKAATGPDPSVPVPCPSGSGASETACESWQGWVLAARSAKLEHVLMILAFSRGQKPARLSLFNAVGPVAEVSQLLCQHQRESALLSLLDVGVTTMNGF